MIADKDMPHADRLPDRRPRRRVWTSNSVPYVLLVAGWLAALVIPLVAGAFWPVSVARVVADAGSVRLMADPISPLPLRNADWVVQPWLSSFIMRASWAIGGLAGLSVLSGVLAVLTMALLYRVARRFAPAYAAAVAVAVVFPLLNPLVLQTQSFALLAAAGTVLALVSSRPWIAPVVVVLWANCHGSAIIGAGLCIAAALGMLRGVDRLVESGWVQRLVLAAGGVAALVATPLGLGIIEYTQSIQSIPGLEALTPVWRPLELSSWRTIVMLGILITVAIVRVPELMARAHASPGEMAASRVRYLSFWYRGAPILLLVGATLFAATATRNVIWFALIALPELSSMLGSHWRLRELRPSLDSRLVAATLLIASIPLLAIMVPGGPVQGRLMRTALPSDRIVSTLGADERTHTFASLEWANYLYLRTGSPVFADARLERYRGVDLRSYLAVTRGNILRLEQITGCARRGGSGSLKGVPPVDRLVLRRKSAGGLVRAMSKAAGSRSPSVGTVVRLGRVELLVSGTDERTIAMSARCVDSKRIGPVDRKEII